MFELISDRICLCRRNFMTSSLPWTSAIFERPQVHRGWSNNTLISSQNVFKVSFDFAFCISQHVHVFTGLEVLTKVPGRDHRGRSGIKIEYCLPHWNSTLSQNYLCEHQLRQLIFRNHYMAVGIIVKKSHLPIYPI